MDQNMLTIYDVTATLFDRAQQKIAHVHVALNAETSRMLLSTALADISEGRLRLRAVVDLYALRAMLTRLFEFNSALLPHVQLRWINGMESWNLFCILPAGMLPIGADDCLKLVRQLLPDLVAASFPGQGLRVDFNPDGRYNPRVDPFGVLGS